MEHPGAGGGVLPGPIRGHITGPLLVEDPSHGGRGGVYWNAAWLLRRTHGTHLLGQSQSATHSAGGSGEAATRDIASPPGSVLAISCVLPTAGVSQPLDAAGTSAH